jgi:hypothetical protein
MFLVDRFRPSIPRQILRLVLVCVALVLSFEFVRRAIPLYFPRDWTNAHEYDALADWKGARLFLLGQSPYSAEGLAAIGQTSMGHPPTTPFWYLPLAEFERSVVAQLSSVILITLLPLHAFLCAKELKYPVPLATALLVSSAVLTTSWFQYHFDAIQYSEPIAFLYVIAWWFLRRNRDVGAGVCLGAALTIKLFPGLLLILLLMARRFRALFAAVGTYLAIAAFMTHGYGLNSWLQFFRQQDGTAREWLGSLQNSSLSGLVVRFMTPACEGQGYPSKRATVISLLCSLLLVALAGWSSRVHLKEARTGDARAIDLPFALFALLSAFLNAWAWEHYYVLTIQPLFVLFAAFGSTWPRALRRWCEHDYSTRRIIGVTLLTLLGFAGVLLTLRVLNVNIHHRGPMAALWSNHRLPFYHQQLHVLDVANFAVWLVPIACCFMAIALSRRLMSLPEPAERSKLAPNSTAVSAA